MVSEPGSPQLSSSFTPTPMSNSNTFSAGILPTPSFIHLINVKLTRENYLLWKAQFMPYFQSHQLLIYVDGSAVCPVKTVTQTTESGATQVPNPAYKVWLQQDQLVLSALLSSLSEEVLSQVLFFSTSYEIW